MKRSPQNLIVFLAMAVIGWNLTGALPPAAVDGDVGPRGKRQIRPQPVSSGPDAAVRKSLDAIRAAGSAKERLRATLGFAGDLPPSEFAAWLDGGWFNLREGFDQALFTRIVKERWLEENPEELVLYLLKKKSEETGSILASWAAREPSRVIRFFQAHPDDVLELDALWGMAITHPGLALQRFQELAATGFSAKAMQESDRLIRQLAYKSPAGLEAALGSLPPVLRAEAEIYLLGIRLSASFPEEVRKLWERPGGWRDLGRIRFNVKGFQDKLFDELAHLPPAWKESVAADSYSLFDGEISGKLLNADLEGWGFTPPQAQRFRTSALLWMVAEQPEAGLEWMGELNFDSDSRQLVIRNAFSSLRENSEKAEGLMALLDSEEDRQDARKAMAAVEDPHRRLNQLMGRAEGRLEKVYTSDFKSGSSYPSFASAEPWDRETTAAMSARFESLPDEKKQQAAQEIASCDESSGIEPSLKGEAIRYLLANPVADGPDPIRTTSEFAANWAVKDPAAAAGWVRTLPKGETKLWAQKNLARHWADYDPKSASQWMATLPADIRSEVQTYLKKSK